MSFQNSRAACVQALERWEASATFADEVLHETLNAERFSVFDRSFLTETFYGVLRQRNALDFLIRQLRDSELDLTTRQVLRLGFYQLFWTRVPHHAAVNETVNLAGRAKGLVNALLRRAIREKAELDAALEAAPPSIRYSHPEFLYQRWAARFGPEGAASLCQWNNVASDIYIRANGLKVTPAELLQSDRQQAAPEGVETTPLHPLALKVRQVPWAWLMQGLCYVQDPSTLMAVELLAPRPGERVLDACAAPGGKTSYMAELMRNEGEIVACDSSRPRLERLRENIQRLNAFCVNPQRVDWLNPGGQQPCAAPSACAAAGDFHESPHTPACDNTSASGTAPAAPFAPESFDRILVDAPCSNTGVIRRRVDVRWRLSSADFVQMPQRQRKILNAVLPLLKPGGTLVYSTCSLEPEENEQVAEAFARDTGLKLTEMQRRTPHEDNTDGAFAARLVKEGPRDSSL